jgi:hypothetical protein
MGPCNRTKSRCPKGNQLQSIPHDTHGRRIFSKVPERHAGKGLYSTIKVPLCVILLFHSKKGWQTPTGPGLSKTQSMDHPKSIPHLYLKPEKCVWEAPRVDYLGLILEKGVTRMDPAKISGISNWPTPTSVKQVRSFLGFCNFYRPFIYQFSHAARPLNELTRKDVPWKWGPEQQQAFEKLRNESHVGTSPSTTQIGPTIRTGS